MPKTMNADKYKIIQMIPATDSYYAVYREDDRREVRSDDPIIAWALTAGGEVVGLETCKDGGIDSPSFACNFIRYDRITNQPEDPPLPPIEAYDDLQEELDKHRAKMDATFVHDEERGLITINALYPYEIELDQIPDPEALVYWIEHLTEKYWMSSTLVGELIRRVYKIKGWDLHRRLL